MTLKGQQQRCSRCGEPGHNARRCHLESELTPEEERRKYLREYLREYLPVYRDVHVANGLCQFCSLPSVDGANVCEKHRTLRSEYAKRTYRRRKAAAEDPTTLDGWMSDPLRLALENIRQIDYDDHDHVSIALLVRELLQRAPSQEVRAEVLQAAAFCQHCGRDMFDPISRAFIDCQCRRRRFKPRPPGPRTPAR